MTRVVEFPATGISMAPVAFGLDADMLELRVARARDALCAVRDLLHGQADGSALLPVHMGALIDVIADSLPGGELEMEEDDP